MDNPARRLADYLAEHQMKATGQTLYTARGAADNSGPGDFEFWQSQAQLAAAAIEVIQILDVMESEGKRILHHRRAVRDLVRGIFGPDLQWGNVSDTAELISEPSLDNLNALAETIDDRTSGPEMSQSQKESVREGLSELYELLKGQELGIGEVEARYLFKLLDEVGSLVDEAGTFGSVNLPRRINELRGSLLVIATDLGDSEESRTTRQKISTALMKIGAVTYGAAGLGFQILGAVADYQQITGHVPGS